MLRTHALSSRSMNNLIIAIVIAASMAIGYGFGLMMAEPEPIPLLGDNQWCLYTDYKGKVPSDLPPLSFIDIDISGKGGRVFIKCDLSTGQRR